MIKKISGVFNLVVTREMQVQNTSNVYLLCQTSNGAINIILPRISSFAGNQLQTSTWSFRIFITDDNNNASVNNITITPNPADTINGSASPIVLNTDGATGHILISGFKSWDFSLGASNGISGSGTPNFIAKFTGASDVGDSSLYDNGNSIGFGTTTPSASSAFDIASSTQGMLFPRVTTAQRDAIPVGVSENSLFLFNTDTRKFNYWDDVSGSWQSVDTHMGTGDVEGSGTTNVITKWTDGANSVIGDGNWQFKASGVNPADANAIIPVAATANVGDTTHRVATLFMSSTVDYSTDLKFESGGTVYMNLTATGNLYLGGGGSAPIITSIFNISALGNMGLTYAQSIYDDLGNELFFIKDNAQVGIKTSTPDASSILDITSTTMGVLVPRMTTAQRNAIGSPATSLLLYNTTVDNFHYRRASGWRALVNAPAASLTAGQVIFATADADVAGDNNLFWDNTNKRLGIGTSSPSATNHIIGSGATSATSSLLIQNSTPVSLFQVRDDGWIGAGETVNNNLSIGFGTGFNAANTSNTFIGLNVGNTITTASNNTGLGSSALMNLTSGNGNVGIGVLALNGNQTGESNVAVGERALLSTTASDNTGLGYRALNSNTSGAANVAVGRDSGFSQTTGIRNTFVGTTAGLSGNGNFNVFIGFQSGYFETGDNKLFIDNTQRANEADARVKAMVYGIFSANMDAQIFSVNGNFGLGGSTVATDAVSVAHIFSGTAPSASITDGFLMYSADIVVGNAAPTFRLEDGSIIRLFTSPAYTITNVTTDRSYNADATNIDEIADVLGTLIADLQVTGLIG